MKLLKSLVLVIAAGLMITACGGGGGATPSDVAKKVMKATLAFDLKEAKKYVAKDIVPMVEESIAELETPEAKAALEMYKGIMASVKFDVTGEEISEDGNTAIVSLKITGPDGETKEDTLTLVKEEDGWKASELPNAMGK